MNDKKYEKLSKFLALILRHKPEVINLKLNNGGWANINDIIILSEKKDIEITLNDILYIVEHDSKGRYIIEENKIRACQGHSINVDMNFKAIEPPNILYHGTATKHLLSIKQNGLNSGNRNYVHLSKDKMTAINVGQRHGKPVVLIIQSNEMFSDKYDFYLSENNVWMTKFVPIKYIKFPF